MSRTELTKDKAALRLAAGRAKAVDMMPYLGTALYAMKPVRSTGLSTFGVDKRWRMYWNPDFTESMSVAEVAGAWLHEVGHLLRNHAERFEALGEPRSKHPLFNIAGDCLINADLRDAQVTVPQIKAWYPERVPGADRQMVAEQIYRLLADGPEGEKITRKQPTMVILPKGLRYDYADGTAVVAITRDAVLDSNTTFDLVTQEGAPVPGAITSVNVISDRQASLTLAAGIEPGAYVVVADAAAASEPPTAPFRIVYPSIRELRPDHIERGYAAPYKVVVVGANTRFDADTTVRILDKEGEPVVDAGNVNPISATYLTFDLPLLADDVYVVEVTAGTEVCHKALPVGVPFLDLTPAELPVGHGVPRPISGIGSDITFDANSTLTVTSLDAVTIGPNGPEFADVTTMFGALSVISGTVVNFDVTQTLPEGQYLVEVTGGAETASAVLTVATGDGDGDGEGGGEGDDEDGEGSGHDDCGSGSGGGKRDYEIGDGQDDNDGSVDEGRGVLIREQVAREIAEHARTRGNVPAGWERWSKEILDPQVDWRKELNAVARRTVANVAGRKDYTYSRPSRRSHAMPRVVLPVLRQPRPPIVDLIVDTSGSMSDKDLAQCLAEIGAIIARVSRGGNGVRVRSCDAATSLSKEVRAVKNITLTGGGGTDMRIGIAAAAAERPKADLIIVLTDGETPWPDAPPETNPHARYVAVLVRGEATYAEVPEWMHKIVINR